MRHAFDLGRLALAGVPVPILEDVSSNQVTGGEYAFAGVPSGPGTDYLFSGNTASTTNC